MGRGAIGYYEVWSESNFWGDTLDCCSEHCRYPVLPGSNSKFRINEMRTPLLLTIEILIPASMQPPVLSICYTTWWGLFLQLHVHMSL